MSQSEACCTCAKLLSDTKVPYDTGSEKPICLDRKLDCCGRTICATCQYHNPRFQSYCPFCQISSEPTSLPSTGPRLPPSYSVASANGTTLHIHDESPPSYEAAYLGRSPEATSSSPPTNTPDVVHFLSSTDTINSLSLAYIVPAQVLRQHNNVFQDSLLAGRKFMLIPHSHYQGPALSTPPDPDEEERKNRIRRWMIATKCADYNVAQLYLKAADNNLQAAIERFQADELWEKEHPLDKGKGAARGSSKRFGFGGLSGQLT